MQSLSASRPSPLVRAAAGRVPVVAGVNAGATRDVVQYSREAEALGAALLGA